MKWKDRWGRECKYTGEVDKNGELLGEGFSIECNRPYMKNEMICLNGAEHAICKSLCINYTASFIYF